ncbi:MAG: sensor histidine kinase, partial [Chitinophagaceae bacterium]
MPVRLRITLLFTALVFVILSLVCGIIYYVSYTGRINNITMRLTNRAVTTARLLSQVEVFDPRLVQRIDAATTLSLKNKSVQAFDYKNHPVYTYSDVPGDTLAIDKKTLDEARIKGRLYLVMGDKEVVAYHYADNNQRIVMVAAAFDEEGKKALARLRNVLLMALLGGVVMAFGGGYFFSRGLLFPIKKIADNVNDISAHNFTARIPTGT